jgi:hypothetical protein
MYTIELAWKTRHFYPFELQTSDGGQIYWLIAPVTSTNNKHWFVVLSDNDVSLICSAWDFLKRLAHTCTIQGLITFSAGLKGFSVFQYAVFPLKKNYTFASELPTPDVAFNIFCRRFCLKIIGWFIVHLRIFQFQVTMELCRFVLHSLRHHKASAQSLNSI